MQCSSITTGTWTPTSTRTPHAGSAVYGHSPPRHLAQGAVQAESYLAAAALGLRRTAGSIAAADSAGPMSLDEDQLLIKLRVPHAIGHGPGNREGPPSNPDEPQVRPDSAPRSSLPHLDTGDLAPGKRAPTDEGAELYPGRSQDCLAIDAVDHIEECEQTECAEATDPPPTVRCRHSHTDCHWPTDKHQHQDAGPPPVSSPSGSAETDQHFGHIHDATDIRPAILRHRTNRPTKLGKTVDQKQLLSLFFNLPGW